MIATRGSSVGPAALVRRVCLVSRSDVVAGQGISADYYRAREATRCSYGLDVEVAGLRRAPVK